MIGFWWLVDFCNKYVSSLWLMLSPWIIHSLTLPSLLASSVSCIALSHLESWCKLRRCIQTPWYDTLYHTNLLISSSKQPPYLPIYGISIAIPRYIAMQLSTVPFIMTRSIIVILLAWSCSWHCICGKATMHYFPYMSLLIHCTILVHHRRHSYRVISYSSFEL